MIEAATARLREAGLPATVEELNAREKRPGARGTRTAYARIMSMRTIDLPLRDCVEIVWTGDRLLRECRKSAARNLLAEATCFFFANFTAFAVDTLPLRKSGAGVRDGSAKGNAAKTADAAKSKAEAVAKYQEIRAQNPRLSHSGACRKVAAALDLSRTTVIRYLKTK